MATPVEILAAGWTIEVGESGTWYQVCGINSMTLTPETKRADTKVFCDQGWESHLVSGRGFTIKLDGYYQEDANGTRDSGQAFIESKAVCIGADAVFDVRLTSPGGNEYQFYATADYPEIGGGVDDATKWSCSLTMTGAPV